jgi:spermidine synthase
VLFLAFFLSGAVALIYQVLWTRQLGLVFGVTIQAASTVLACFMGGLAIGSYLAGRWSDRLRNPLAAFALVEVLIGASALASPFALELADRLYLSLLPWLGDTASLTIACRVALTALVLIVPSMLMGMTYPLVLSALGRDAAAFRRSASLLYAVNTTGAIAGVLASSLWLVPSMGLARTFLVGAALNLAVAVLAWSARAPGSWRPKPAQPAAPTDEPPTDLLPQNARVAVLLVIALSGAVSLALEIIWFRVLVFFLRPTTYAFASMLAAVLGGLAIGSYLVTPFMRRRLNWLAILGLVEVAIAVLALTSAFALVRANDVMGWLFGAAAGLTPPYHFVVPLLLAAAFAITPTAILLGAAFPIGLVLWSTGAERRERPGGRVGVLYALNVTGAIVGSLGAGFVLIPHFGAQNGLVLVTAVPLVGGLVLLWLAAPSYRVPAAAVGVSLYAVAALTLPDIFREVIVERYRGHEVVWHAEDAQATVTVVQHGSTRSLLIDGMHHANDAPGMVNYHRALGTLAVALHPSPRRVLIVGMGGGATAGGASILPDAHTTVVELSPSVIEAGRFFQRVNRRVLQNRRVTFHVGDGRQFLKATDRRFDVITADLMLPTLAGAANLYSADYFVLARSALAPGGLMVQWIPGDTEEAHKLILRSFVATFPYVTLWMGGSIAVGSKEPQTLDRAAFAAKTTHPAVLAALQEAGFGSFELLVGQYFTGRAEAEQYLGEGPMLVDDRPVVEYFLALPQDAPPPDLSPYAGRPDELLAVPDRIAP